MIGQASLRSYNFHSGIMLLEKQILQLQSYTHQHPQTNKSPFANNIKEYIYGQLTKLYKAIGISLLSYLLIVISIQSTLKVLYLPLSPFIDDN